MTEEVTRRANHTNIRRGNAKNAIILIAQRRFWRGKK